MADDVESIWGYVTSVTDSELPENCIVRVLTEPARIEVTIELDEEVILHCWVYAVEDEVQVSYQYNLNIIPFKTANKCCAAIMNGEESKGFPSAIW